jgi:hypothetical protein
VAITIMAQRKSNAKCSGRRGLRVLATAAWVLLLVSVTWAQTTTQSATPRAHRANKPRATHAAPAVPQPAADVPPQPEMPKWPVNEAPGQPTVTWNSLGLRIQASNSSLSQILNTVSTQTGAKIEGVSRDERIFGDYGPGTARDVLSQLLRGSDYNFLLLGDQGQGTPRQVILTARRGGAVQGNTNRGGFNPQQQQESQPEDDPAEQQPEQPEEPPQPVQPPPQQVPQQEQMNPQQRMQMMQQQRLQQMQQLQQQYQQQQQQPQPQPQ